MLRNLADGVAFTIVIWAQWRIAAWALSTARWKGAARAAVATVAIWLAAGLALNTHVVVNAIEPPSWLRGIVSGGAYLWAFSTTAAYLLFRGAPHAALVGPARMRVEEARIILESVSVALAKSAPVIQGVADFGGRGGSNGGRGGRLRDGACCRCGSEKEDQGQVSHAGHPAETLLISR